MPLQQRGQYQSESEICKHGRLHCLPHLPDQKADKRYDDIEYIQMNVAVLQHRAPAAEPAKPFKKRPICFFKACIRRMRLKRARFGEIFLYSRRML